MGQYTEQGYEFSQSAPRIQQILEEVLAFMRVGGHEAIGKIVIDISNMQEAITELQEQSGGDEDTIKAIQEAISLIQQSITTINEKLAEIDIDKIEDIIKNSRKVIAVRQRDPSKPSYDDGDDTIAVALLVDPHSGRAQIEAIVSGKTYDAANMSTDGQASPDGTIIIKEE